MKKRTYISLLVLSISLFLPLRTLAVGEGKYHVDLKDGESRQVLVAIPDGETVTADDDFAVLGQKGVAVAFVYPFELQEGRFWSQPLSPGAYMKILTGSPVERSPLSGERHREVREAGSAQWETLERERRNERLFRLREAVKKKRETEERHLSRLDSLREAELAAEKDLLRTEEVNERRILSIEEDVDDLFREILDLYDDREELFRVREQLAKVKPRPDEEIRHVSDKIAKASRSIKRRRRDVVHLREKWRDLRDEIRVAERKLREISLEAAAMERELRSVEEEVESLLAELEEEERIGEGRNP